MACISLELPRDEENAEIQLVEAIRDYGRVITHAPVQIAEIQERPGAMLVKWMEVSALWTPQHKAVQMLKYIWNKGVFSLKLMI